MEFEGNFLVVAAPPLTSTIAPKRICIFTKSYAFFALPKRQIKQSEVVEMSKQVYVKAGVNGKIVCGGDAL
ncbi:MAG: hypothetical protein HFE28_05600 [Clostridia bacterium]|nr:hypothetical protein [Clostridia bacterium]